MKKILFLAILSLFTGITFAQGCPSDAAIYGPTQIKKGTVNEYTIVPKMDASEKTTFKLFKNEKNIEWRNTSIYKPNMSSAGDYVIKADINTPTCKITLEKNISVYEKVLVYIGDNAKEFDLGIDENLKKQNIFLEKILTTTAGDDLIWRLWEKSITLKNAESIIINTENFDQILQILSQINTEDIGLISKHIILVNDSNKVLLRKIIGKYLKILNINEIQIISSDYFLKFFWDVSLKKNMNKEKYIKTINSSITETPKYLIISYLTDYLIYQWLPINLIALLLTITLATLLITIFRQIIWFSVFGIYNPLLFALSLPFIGVKTTLILFLIAFIATSLTRRFTKKIYLLHSAKMSILITIYLLLIILTTGLSFVFNVQWIDSEIFKNTLVIFPVIFSIIVANKVFYEEAKIFSKTWLISVIEFAIITMSVYFITNWTTLKNLLLAYPESIIIILILNILIGRFTWLQILEIFRFKPLLKSDDEEE